MSSVEQPTWSESSSSTNAASPSSLWSGRPPSIMDSDAVTTASASNVSTPGRAPSALDGKDVSANAPIFTPSPLLPQDGSAWSMPRPVSLTWANDLSSNPPPADLVSNSATLSPNATKRASAKDPATQVSPPSSSLKDGGASATKDASSAASPGNKKEPAAPVPKRAPIRSATLDPRHLAAKRRPSEDDDDSARPSSQAVAAQDTELIDELGSLTIATDSVPGSSIITQQQGYSSPPAVMHVGHHAHHPSASFPPPPFSPVEVFMHPSSYLPGSGARSPDGYGHSYPGMHPAMAPIDMSGYESYRTTPDPYAPTMPGRAIFASPGSQGSTPQSPSFGSAPVGPHFNPSIRNGEAHFYPGVIPGFGPPTMAGGMPSNIRPIMSPGPGQYGYGPGPGVEAHSSQLAQSPMIAPGMPIPVGGIVLPPTSPSMNAQQMSPSGSDRSHSLSQSSPYAPHRRMGSSSGEPYGPGMMSPRPPFGMTSQAGPFVPGQPPMHSMMGGAPMHASMMAWNGRFHHHRRVPTGPGGVMAPPGGYSMGVGGGPMDMHYGRSGPGFYGAAPFHPGGGGSSISGAGPSSSNNSPHGHSRSPLLEEFRSRHAKNRKFELSDIYGSVVEFSSDQHGSRFIQEKLDTATPEEKQKVFDEVLPHARQLMSDVFGNYVIQKMLEHGDDSQRNILSAEIEGHVLSLSLGTYGCRVVQKAFDYISPAQREKLAQELDGHIMDCVRDQNANHVVQKIIERVDPSAITFIPNAFVGHVPSLASHCYSCRVLQRTFEHASPSQSRPLLDELHKEVVVLMQHQYGNYVVQWVLQRGEQRDKRQVIDKIKGRILVLSRHKFASNVIEEVVRTAKEDFEELLDEILTPISSTESTETSASSAPPTPGVPAVLMMRDQYANYVLQRFIQEADAQQRQRLIDVVRPSLVSARRASGSAIASSKHLLAIERLIDSLAEREA